jgi:Cdc6-like AAA superfamily ATPase
MTDAERYRLISKINSAFTPSAPINSRDLFAGRGREVDRAVGTIFQPGQHVVLYGERGVGKTSLANTLFDLLVIMGKYNYQRAKINCSESMSFEDVWRSLFKQLHTMVDGEEVDLDHTLPANPNSEAIREVFQLMDDPSIVIIDELDRVTDTGFQTVLADTIKTLSDNIVDTTVIMIGVADSLDQLIAEHRSIDRAMRQIQIPRMSKKELLEIVDKGLKQCEGLAIAPQVRDRIADYSQGLPEVTHLLAREAALHAVQEFRTYVIMPDLDFAIREAVDSQLESNLMAYRTAVTAPRGKNFKPVLLSCALAAKDEHGFFYATNVTQPLRQITSKSYGIPAFARHLQAFSETSRGPILERRGRQYRFIKPMMEPYIILRGLADGMINEEQLSRPSATSTVPEQLSLLSPSVGPLTEL